MGTRKHQSACSTMVRKAFNLCIISLFVVTNEILEAGYFGGKDYYLVHSCGDLGTCCQYQFGSGEGLVTDYHG